MFTGIRKAIQKLNPRLSTSRFSPPAAGLYHYLREENGERSRIHLRLDEDTSGLLLVNANRVIHLNPTAALMAYLALENIPSKQAIAILAKMYRAPGSQIKSDYLQLNNQLNELVRPEGACPIHELEIETKIPFSARPSAPYRMDLALTYRCNNECAHCYNDRPRNYTEISTDQWKIVLDKLWQIGIPHVVFTGGEPTLRHDLPELIAHAETNGQITGINTNGRRLSDVAYLNELVEAGLDHVQVTVESHDPLIHDAMVLTKGAWKQTIAGVRNALDTPLYVMTNTTMLRQNSPSMADTLDFLANLGVPTIGLNALIYSGRGSSVGTGLHENELLALLELARNKTDQYHQKLIWYTPTQYCHFDPMQLELGVKGCTAALYNMCIESDGSVIPCQSYYEPLGNIFKDSWESIWNHDLSISLRERRYVPKKCHDCTLLSECGGGCPLKIQSGNSAL
ncbi:MAG: radical SAM protein [Anaerolineales bacterium]|nr:MAG: radical SAM protein [Anaerolineales bacterium]